MNRMGDLFSLPKSPMRTFASAKTAAPISYCDELARVALVQLSLDPSVDALEFVPNVEISGTLVPIDAIIIVRQDAKWLLDLVDSRPLAELDELGLRLLATEKIGLPQFQITSEDLNQQPYADNCRLVWLCQSEHVPASDRIRILQAVGEEGSMSLIEAAERCRRAADPISAVLALVCADLLEAELKNVPLGPETRISRRLRLGEPR
jgi:hypothetical protein